MTKSEILARDQHIIDVVSGAVYRENGECINVKCDGSPHKWPLWEFTVCNYELFTPDFSWKLFKEGLLLVSCNYKEYERFRAGLKAQGITQWADGESIESADPFSKGIVNNRLFGHQYSGLFLALTYPRKGNRIVVDFSSIPPELPGPAFEPRKPETFTKYEWGLLTPEERTACNELIRGEIEHDNNGKETNLEWYDPDTGYWPTICFTSIDLHQYRTKPKPEYEPYDKPEAWMVGKIIIYKTDSSVRLVTGIYSKYITVNDMGYTMEDLFENSDLYDPATDETRPFGKLKGGE